MLIKINTKIQFLAHFYMTTFQFPLISHTVQGAVVVVWGFFPQNPGKREQATSHRRLRN